MIKRGSIVQLQTGGPSMTALETKTLGGWDTIMRWRCAWFVGDELRELVIPESALKEVRQ